MNNKKRVYTTFVFIVVFLGGMYSGITLYDRGYLSSRSDIGLFEVSANDRVNFKQFWETWDFVKKNYISDQIKDSDLFYGALSGLLGALKDPYSTYFNPTEAKEFNDALNGDFEGIGAYVDKKEGKVLIVSPLPGSPAEKAGLKPLDQIISINDTLIEGMSLDEVVTKIRGPKNTSVTLSIYRKEKDELIKVEVKRQAIHIPSVSLEYKDEIPVIKIYSFNADVTKSLLDTINKVVEKKPKGMIIDLRGNPGGFLDQVVNVVGFWVGEKPVVIERGRDNYEKIHTSEFSQRISNTKIVVLVDGASASAAEIFAGALQDYGVATIMGTTSFGKGSVQRLEDYPDGSAFKLTIAKWYTPNNHGIDGSGIKPDVEIKFDTELFSQQNIDNQLMKAIQLLKEK